MAGGCENLNWPFHHHQAEATPSAEGSEGSPNAHECADLLAQIRQSQEERRQAVATSVNPDIVNAAQGKADQQIEELRHRYDELDCPAEAGDSTRRHRQPPLQPAPGAGAR